MSWTALDLETPEKWRVSSLVANVAVGVQCRLQQRVDG
jgi:hypothetical protein